MRIYYHDHLLANKRRNWTAMLGSDALEVPNLKMLPPHPGVLVAHIESVSAAQALSVGLSKKSIWAVVVSGTGYPDGFDRNGVYFRRCKVESGIDVVDHYFHQCFEEFWNDLKDQERKGGQIIPQFSLLDPTGIPEQLLAWTLVHHVPKLNDVVVFEMDKVKNEYNKLRGALKSRGNSEKLPPEWDGLGDETELLTASKELIKLARADI